MLWNAFAIALREIRRNLTRAFLTVLGVIIGVSAVVTMVTLGQGATEAVRNEISSLGSNLIIVRPGSGFGPRARSSGVPNFSETDVRILGEQVPGIAAIAPARMSSFSSIYRENARSTTVTGSTPEFFQINNWELADGRFFTDADNRSARAVAVIGDTVREELFGDEDPLGAKIRLGTVSVEVIGLLESKGQAGMGDQDDTIILPLATFQRRLAGRTTEQDINVINISAADDADTTTLISEVTAIMRERRNLGPSQENDFNVFDTQQIADTLSSSTQVMTTLLAAVASVSLFVGGIGIMNIMLVSVTERTREIGIRLSIGATAREVLLQFLVEAVTLSAVGGLVGLGLALGISVMLAQIIGVTYTFNPGINLLSFFVSAAIGIIFGYTPARRAAQLDPIDALRHE